MDIEKRKSEIRQKLTLSKYPRRSAAKFTDENDHNPLILQDCPECYGSGNKCIEENNTAVLFECDKCHGTGLTGETERYFKNDNPVIEIRTYKDNWVKCPFCDRRFNLKDQNAWTGYRHIRCGQRLVIKGSA